MRIVFMGTPAFAVPTLEALVQRHEVIAVYTQPPRPGGRRGRELVASPVQRCAQALGIDTCCPERLHGADEQATFRALNADVAVVAAYGLILPPPVLAAPRHGCLNIHASLLPRWRGAAPIQRAILAGDAETGVCIMRMEAGLDTGPVLLRKAEPIDAHVDAGTLSHRLSLLGADLMTQVLADPAAFPPDDQPLDGITYAAKIDKAEARISWSEGAHHVDRQIRAFNPAPGAWFEAGGERIKVLAAAVLSARDDYSVTDFPTDVGVVLDDQLAIGCGSGAIRPTLVQRAGRGVTTADELLRGFPIPTGTRLG